MERVSEINLKLFMGIEIDKKFKIKQNKKHVAKINLEDLISQKKTT